MPLSDLGAVLPGVFAGGPGRIVGPQRLEVLRFRLSDGVDPQEIKVADIQRARERITQNIHFGGERLE